MYFITGGNGSGKSTLVKVLSGLYEPFKGSVQINGKRTSFNDLGQYLSCIFTDSNLFNHVTDLSESNNNTVQAGLKKMNLHKKVNIENGRLTNVEGLSQGEKKRLSLVIASINEKEVYIFDEWAANQDPEFREVFYKALLPQIKNKNKIVIVVSHDEKYFNLADVILKLDFGKLSTFDSYREYQKRQSKIKK